MKLLVAAWLVLPQFMGAAYLYERFVRDHIRKYVTEKEHQRVHHHPPENNQQQKQNKKSPTGAKTKKKFVDFIIPKKVSSSIHSTFFSSFYQIEINGLIRYVVILLIQISFNCDCVANRGIRRRIELC